MAKPAVSAKSSEPERPFLPESVSPDDFFRLKRVGNCWQVEMVRLDGEKVRFRRGVYVEDVLGNTQRKLLDYAESAERRR